MIHLIEFLGEIDWSPVLPAIATGAVTLIVAVIGIRTSLIGLSAQSSLKRLEMIRDERLRLYPKLIDCAQRILQGEKKYFDDFAAACYAAQVIARKPLAEALNHLKSVLEPFSEEASAAIAKAVALMRREMEDIEFEMTLVGRSLIARRILSARRSRRNRQCR